jgi:hypothetical protein
MHDGKTWRMSLSQLRLDVKAWGDIEVINIAMETEF